MTRIAAAQAGCWGSQWVNNEEPSLESQEPPPDPIQEEHLDRLVSRSYFSQSSNICMYMCKALRGAGGGGAEKSKRSLPSRKLKPN